MADIVGVLKAVMPGSLIIIVMAAAVLTTQRSVLIQSCQHAWMVEHRVQP